MSKNYGTKYCKLCRKKYYPTNNKQKFCTTDCYKEKKKLDNSKTKKARKIVKDKRKDLVDKRRKIYLNKKYIRGIEGLADYLGVSYNELVKGTLNHILKEAPYEKLNVSYDKSGSEKFYNKKELEKYFTKIGFVKPIDRMITISNYKEPLTPTPEGYGYLGTISQTQDGEYIQCHICGKLMKHMSGHLRSAHKMNTRDYKQEYGIALKTALTAEKTRWEMKRRTIEYVNSLSGDEKKDYFEKRRKWLLEGRKKRTAKQPKKALEAYNKNGTCPLQLLDKIREVASDLGHTPALKEFVTECGTQRYKHLIIKTHGSWNKAVEKAGLEKHNAKNKPKRYKKYTDEELLEYLRIFAEENNEIPTHTDFISGSLPREGVYVRRFGSIDKARRLAGVYDVVDQEIVEEFNGKVRKQGMFRGVFQFNPLSNR